MEQNNQLVKGIKNIEQCRICQNKNLKHILTLGNQYLVDFLDNKEDTNYVAPLELVLCSKKDNGCGLLQLQHTNIISLFIQVTPGSILNFLNLLEWILNDASINR